MKICIALIALVASGCATEEENTALCGNGRTDAGEGCDSGSSNSDNLMCTSRCQIAACGDGLVLLGVETCDDGEGNSNSEASACRADCTEARCGDGVKDAGEQCDDGHTDARGTCNVDCSGAGTGTGTCGDGVRHEEAGEQCDDDNTDDDGNGCDAVCQRYDVCGNGTVESLFETCDDGNTDDRDGCDSSCALEPGWAWVPGGTFMMGCSPGDTTCDDGEKPRHWVMVSGFVMMKTEITQEHYRSVMGSNPSVRTDCPTCPVEHITWQEAKDFCTAIGVRLPSEAEWEYAARGGTTTKLYCGDEWACLDGIAWCDEGGDDADNRPHPVGRKTPNAYGLHDMLGNVWEFTEDCWHSNYDGAPDDGSAWKEEDCTKSVLRGGSWRLGPWVSRASFRYWDNPVGGLSSFSGARCAQ